MIDGIRRNISIGYIVNSYVNNGIDENGIPNLLIKNFTIYEVSVVAAPADYCIGYKRSIKENTIMTEEIKEEIIVNEEIEKEEKVNEEEIVNEEKVNEEIIEEETIEEKIVDETEEIKSLGELTEEEQLAAQAIEEKRSLKEFKEMIKIKRNHKEKRSMENKYFSITKAIRNCCKQYKGDISKDYESKVIAENKRSMNIQDEYDIVIKKDNLRALGNTAGKGAELINTSYLPSEFTPAARPEITLEKTGYTTIPVEGNAVSFAVVTSGATAAMYGLDGELADGDLSFALKTLTPHKAGVCIPIPYSLLLQGRPETDAIVEQDIVNALQVIKDNQVLTGTGADNQLTGIANIAGVNTVTAAEIVTWAGVCKAEKLIRDNNYFGKLAWVMNSNKKLEFETTLKDDNGFAGYLCEDDLIKGIPVYVNNALDNNTVILGQFDKLVVADFDGIMIKVDDITYIKKGAVQVIATAAFDSTVRAPGAFTVSKNA